MKTALQRSRLLILAACLPLLAVSSEAMQIELKFRERKCFQETVEPGRSIKCDFHASDGLRDMQIDLFVANSRGRVVAHRTGLSHYKFSLSSTSELERDSALLQGAQSPPGETFRFCVMHQGINGQIPDNVTRKITFNIRLAMRKEDTALLVKKDTANATIQNLRELKDAVRYLIAKMDRLREAEATLSSLNASTTQQLLHFSSLTSIFVLVLGFLQTEAIQVVLRNRKLLKSRI